ncbi:endo-1,4-beta-xylanase [Aestuariibacter sp. A3R04]|nr:endo-1,4-beta-xylanase [Aestuariibacter sp. A3R04]
MSIKLYSSFDYKEYEVKLNLLVAGILSAVVSLTGCSNEPADTISAQGQFSLKEAFKDKFAIGAAVNELHIADGIESALVAQHYNTLTPENMMKWEEIHPQPDQFSFSRPDALVAFSERQGIQLVGHTLVWHSQTPDWVFYHQDGTRKNRAELLTLMKSHIEAVAGRYKGRVYAWDVVNEAFNEDGTLRQSLWYEIIGDDYLDMAFEYAHEAAPNARLYYNDYNLFKPAKRKGVIELVKRLKSKGIQIDGVGMQAHYALDYPSFDDVEASIEAFSAQGVDVMITELDISVLPFPDDENMGADVGLSIALQDEYNPYTEVLPKEKLDELASRYEALFAIFNRHSDKVGRVTFWGVHDAHSWRNNWPMPGRKDYPLLFGHDKQLKTFATRLPYAG